MRPYIDVHVHIGLTINRDPKVGQNTARYMARMAATGIVAAIIGPTAVGSPQARGVLDTREQNETIARACREFPERFPIGLALFELRHGDQGVDELDRALSEGGLMGVMYHPSGGGIGAEVNPFLEVAAMHSGLCLLHGSPADTAVLARRFPGATFLVSAAHQGIDECARLDNCWFEIVQRPKGANALWDLAQVTNVVGRERVLFGGDTPYYDYRVVQAQIEAAPVDESLKDRIAYENALALIRRFRPGWDLPREPVAPPRAYTVEELFAARGERLL